MRIAVFGCGYVGLVSAACLAEVGNHVIGIDTNEERIAQLNQGHVPIFEPGLESIIQRCLREQQLKFTTDAHAAIQQADIIFIAVGTPTDVDGSADLCHVLNVADTIGRQMNDSKLIVIKSTVPVGTNERVCHRIIKAQRKPIPFLMASNPEFLKEGAAIEDFKKPDRIIIGTDHNQALETLTQLYKPFNRNHQKLIAMDIASAELTKYAANAMLATRISFMNEMAQIASRVGADIEQVRIGIGSDPRIGYSFIYPGAGYGGSCFPKDIRALKQTANEHQYQASLLAAVESINQNQKRYLFQLIQKHFNGQLKGRRIALWGLAFKPNTNDMREAPSHVLMEQLWQAGCSVCAYDPKAMPEARKNYGEHSQFSLAEDPYQATYQADALVVITEWKRFWSPDLDRLKQLMKQAVIFDGRNIYDPQQTHNKGFIHYSIGRPAQLTEQNSQQTKTNNELSAVYSPAIHSIG